MPDLSVVSGWGSLEPETWNLERLERGAYHHRQIPGFRGHCFNKSGWDSEL